MKHLNFIKPSIIILLALCSIVKSQQLRRRLQNETDVDISKLRYLTLEASATWGATLPDRTTGYPYQLSPNVTNLAIRASGPNYPSICLQSMIGDAIYDVIVLEFLMGCGEGLDKLSMRLRQRFPEAIIILNIMWVPLLIAGKDTKGEDTSFYSVYQKYRTMSPDIIKNEFTEIDLNRPVMTHLLNYHEKIKNDIDAYYFGMEEITTPEWKNKDWIADRLSLYNDPPHYSQKGHDFIANGIKDLLRKLQPKPSNNLGTFGEGDSCHMWYSSGKVTVDYSPKEEIKLNEFAPVKYALEIPSQGGEFVINNPFSSERNLMMSYMSTGPDHTMYPDAEITINGAFDKQVKIHPLATDYKHKVHISKTTNLGKIPPGDNNVHIKPLEMNDELVSFPFRVVALSVVGDADPNGNFAAGGSLSIFDK